MLWISYLLKSMDWDDVKQLKAANKVDYASLDIRLTRLEHAK